MKRTIGFIVAGLILVLLFSCASSTGVSKSEYAKTQNMMKADDAAMSVASIKSQADSYKDKVLYYLDLGMAQLYAGQYQEAVDSFAVAQDAIDEYGIASVSENVEALLVNDYSIAYPGEKYEELLVNIFSAIAYYMMGNEEDAMVELRQAEVIYKDFKANMQEQEGFLEKLVLAITPNPFRYLDVPKVKDFTGSNLASYMSLIMYRNNNDLSNASVDLNRIKGSDSYAGAVKEDEINVESGKVRVNLVSFEGLIGQKKGIQVMVPGSNGANHVVSWPWFEPSTSQIKSVTLTCSNGQSVNTAVLEDFNDIALRALAMEVKVSYLKSFYRGYTKVTAAKAAADEAYKAAVKAADAAYSAAMSKNKLAGMLAGAARSSALDAAEDARSKALEEVNKTEVADTRMGQYLPARVSVAGLSLDPGTYDFTVTYKLSGGSDIVRTFTGVEVSEGKSNLIFASCAK